MRRVKNLEDSGDNDDFDGGDNDDFDGGDVK